MILGQRVANLGASGWKNPYVTDGLVAMWDGEWNAGGGVHDANATVWKDLVSGTDSESFSEGYSVGESWIEGTVGELKLIEDASSYFTGRTLTIECVREEILIGNTRNAARCIYVLPIKFGAFYFRHAPDMGGALVWLDNKSYKCIVTPNYSVSNKLIPKSSSSLTFNNGIVHGFLNSVSYNTYASGWDGGGDLGDNKWIGIGPAQGGKSRHYNIRIYSRILTEAEIAANYAVDKERFGIE